MSKKYLLTTTMICCGMMLSFSNIWAYPVQNYSCSNSSNYKTDIYCYNSQSGGNPSSTSSDSSYTAVPMAVGDISMKGGSTIILHMECSGSQYVSKVGIYKKKGGITCSSYGGSCGNNANGIGGANYCEFSCSASSKGLLNINSFDCTNINS